MIFLVEKERLKSKGVVKSNVADKERIESREQRRAALRRTQGG